MRLPGRKLGLFWQSYLGVVEVEGVEVGRDPAGLDELPAAQEVVAVRVHQHEGDLRERDMYRVIILGITSR